MLAWTGRTVLADTDILRFFLDLSGWVSLFVVATLVITITALELAALMGILAAADAQTSWTTRTAILFATSRAWPIVRLTGRIVALTTLALAPLLALAGLTYVMLLTRYDINYYLDAKPPAFWGAVGCGAVLACVAAFVLGRLAVHWFVALPIVCFESIAPRHALRTSRGRVTGQRWRILVCLAAWGLASLLISYLATEIVLTIARRLVPRAAESLGLLLLSVGLAISIFAVVNLVINVLNTVTFAVMLYRIYRHVSPEPVPNSSLLKAGDGTMTSVGMAWSRRRLELLVLCGVLAVTASGAVLLSRVSTDDACEIIAHRGASATAPENSLAAVRQAITDQTDWVEIDVQETADGEVVVVHDSDFKKLAGVPTKVWNITHAELATIDIGSRFGAEFRGERVPTLAEVLDCCRGKTRLVIELKYYGHDQQLEQRVVDLVEAHAMQSHVAVMSLRQDGVDKIQTLRPTWRTGLLTAVAVGQLANVPTDFLAVKADMGTRKFVQSVHARGKQVYVWTVNDPVSISLLINRGVDGIITDKPALARTVLQERAELSFAERVLLHLADDLGVVPQFGSQ
jgi:glycerophosphoryl diester phosphodiesterase